MFKSPVTAAGCHHLGWDVRSPRRLRVVTQVIYFDTLPCTASAQIQILTTSNGKERGGAEELGQHRE